MIRPRQTAILGVLIVALSFSIHAMAKSEKDKPKADDEDIPVIDTSVDPATLPEQYEAEVLIEAPIVWGGTQKEGEFHPGETPYYAKFDVSIGSDGGVYILDPLNNRIQVFDKEGRYSRSIGIEDGFRTVWNDATGDKLANFKTQLAIDEEGFIWLLDSAANEVVKLDQEGREVGRVKIAGDIKKVDAELFSKGVMFADKEGPYLELNDYKAKKRKKVKIRDGKIEVVDSDRIWCNRKFDINYKVEKAGKGAKVVKLHNKGKIKIKMISEPAGIHDLGEDQDGNRYLMAEVIYKISGNGKMVAKVSMDYWWEEPWAGQAMKDIARSTLVGPGGNVYLCQNTGSKIRIIRLRVKR